MHYHALGQHKVDRTLKCLPYDILSVVVIDPYAVKGLEILQMVKQQI